jgi:hypothetical protein
LANLGKHLETLHLFKSFKSSNRLWDNDTKYSKTLYHCIDNKYFEKAYTWEPIRILFGQKSIFFLKMSRNQHGIWLIWLYFAGFPEEADKYSCTINAHNKYEKEESWLFNGKVIPLTTKESTVSQEGIGLILTDQIVKKILNKKYQDIRLDVEIRRLASESESEAESLMSNRIHPYTPY